MPSVSLTQKVSLFQITNFTLLIGVPLNDQSEDGMGNLALLKGAHHAVERVFQMQAALGGPLGPGGPNWEREDPLSPTTHGVNMMPPSVRDEFATNADGQPAVVTEKGRVWPCPTLVHTVPGDAVIVLNHTPHAPTYILSRRTPDDGLLQDHRRSCEGGHRLVPGCARRHLERAAGHG